MELTAGGDMRNMGTECLAVRNVAEHAYCPRLFYYMAVEGVFVPSADTVQGVGVHSRVDRPSTSPAISSGKRRETKSGIRRTQKLQDSEADADRPEVIRSLALSSERLGITAKLDLAEVNGNSAVPVEYRKGHPSRRRVTAEAVDEMLAPASTPPTPEPWPTDRVQVGLQVLLLEDAGYSVPQAILYYAAEKRRLELPVTDALRQAALAELSAAQRTAGGPRPAPLINDPKCPRCSLQPICLPDEVHSLCAGRHGTVPAQTVVQRKLWPPRDDGIHVVLQREGVRVGVRGKSVRITDQDGQLVRDMPLSSMESLALVGAVQVSTQALQVFADHEIPVAFLTSAGRLTAMMDPLGPTSAAVRTAQIRTLDDSTHALELARAVIIAKIANQRTLLMRNHGNLPASVASDMQAAHIAAERAITLDELRGHEGNAAAIYFKHFSGMFKEDARAVAARFDENGRQRRPPPDPTNAVLSFGYSMLTNECTAACRLASLEPTVAALHATRPGRPAMSLDLMEPFRPLIADSVAISAFNRGELTQGHFLDTAAGCALTDAGRKAFFSAYGRRMDTEVTHPIFGYRLSYRRMLMLHARLIAAWLLGEVPNLTFLTTR